MSYILRLLLSTEEKVCPKCNHELHEMLQKVRKELIFVPAKVEVINHIEHVYSCRNCEKNDIEATIIKASGPTPLISGSIASSSLVANIINDKYVKSLPLYRQEVSYQRMGINLNRQNMSNWLIRVSNSYFKPIIDHMYKQLIKAKYINADETSVQVLHEPGKAASSKAYMWVYMTGRSEKNQYVLFNYEPSRAHKHAIAYLKDFNGILISDGYQAYDKVEGVTQAGCWAHARQKFKEALDLVPKNVDPESTETYKCFSMINELFAIERKNKDCDYDQLTKIRQEESLPKADEFFNKIHELKAVALPKSHLGEAITYAHNQESKLRTYLSDGRIDISNNAAENIIRPFTVGRKNWLFMNNVKDKLLNVNR
ncbi:MAG: IS66 family transposase [Erysipelotrichaceae bacterium]|nr:IS66 family transposase [Erysipelotrichaceae bacterium]